MSRPTCTQCGSHNLSPGFLSDSGQGANGFTKWIEGALERGIFGGAKVMGRPKRELAAYRCSKCGHLELYADEPD